MDRSLFRFILRHSKRQQVVLLVAILFTYPINLLQYELPKQIIDRAIGGSGPPVRVMFANALRLGDYVYGTSGDFGPVFMTALNVHTGEEMWQARGFGRASLLYADSKAIIIDEDGSLVLATLSPDGVEVLSRTSLFETTSWTAPSLVGSTLFVRDRARIMALDLGAS